MDRASINAGLQRKLLSGAEYERFMPASDCSSTKLGDGDTGFAIHQMEKTAQKYQHHTKKLAQGVFKGLPLSDLCKKLHHFLYWHFQYAIDDHRQKLRSPACSWASRKEGIDCKSYSIFASSVLLNLGIKHYMRRIVQPSNPEGFTHVYVIVPIHQKTGDLSQGYYVIDGTINSSQELAFLEKDDVPVFVQGLGAPSLGNPYLSGVQRINGNTLRIKSQAWEDFIKAIDNLALISSQNTDLEAFKLLIYHHAQNGTKPQHFRMEGFTAVVDGEKFVLFAPAEKGLGTPMDDAIDALLDEANQNAKRNVEMRKEIEKKVLSMKVGAVGNAVSSAVNTASLFAGPSAPVLQGIAAAIQTGTALVQLAIMLWYDPCSGAFYTTEYINHSLKGEFLPEYKNLLNRVMEYFSAGTPMMAVSDLNTLFKEVDLGYAHYKNALEIGESNPCSQEALKGYDFFVTNIRTIVTNMLTELKANLSESYNIPVIDVQGKTSERMWYFIVPASRNPISAKYRKLRFEERINKRGIYPYDSEQGFEDWLSDNQAYLAVHYGSVHAERYRQEMLPFKEKIRAIRQNLYLSVGAQLSLEEELRKQEYEIYLKYDINYKKELLKEAQDAREAYAMANAAFIEELKKIRKIRQQDEARRAENIYAVAKDNADRQAGNHRKKLLQMAIFGGVGLGLLYILKK